MNIKECVEKSVFITTEYYNNNIEPYFGHMAENVVWHGPAIGQHIVGLDNMRKAWENEKNVLTFSLGNIEAQYIQTTTSACEIMLIFVVTTFYPNGDSVPILQRVHFSWADCSTSSGREPKIFMIHISNPVEQHSSDFIYPIHYNELRQKMEAPSVSPRISLHGSDNAFYLLSPDTIAWAESQPDRRCLLHLRDKTVKARVSLAELEKLTEGTLIRVHSGYIVNPCDVVSVRRFFVTLSDGSEIPIPEKKYSSVKKLLLNK